MPIIDYEFQVNGATFSYKFWDEGLCHTHHMEEKPIRDQVWDIRDGMYVVDMGAGCGDYTLTAIRRGAHRVYAFEPFPDTFELLRRNVILNKWQDRCVLSSLAISSSDNDERIDPKTFTLSKTGLPIRATTLDNFIEWLSIPPPQLDWIKIDIETYEIEAAHGMVKTVRKYKPKILIEIHGPNTIEQFLAIIDANYQAESLANYINSGTNSHWLCTKRT